MADLSSVVARVTGPAERARRGLGRRLSGGSGPSRTAAWEALLAASPSPVLVLSGDGVVTVANDLARDHVPRVAVGVRADAVSAELEEALAEALAGRTVDRREVLVDGEDRRTFEATLRPFGDEGGTSTVVVLVDVTKSVDFREARRLFSAAVSHELRTPLARILGLAETLALPLGQEEREALVAQTEVEVDTLRRLMDEMLLLAALDRGDAALADGAADAAATARSIVEDRLGRPTTRGRALQVDAPAEAVVPVPPRLLDVVVGNLVDNALRHGGPEAEVELRVRSDGQEVEIAVRDTGVGIDPSHLPHVFERFFRGDASRQGPGTGLGLALVKHIVEAHGGRVGAESSLGRGTTVCLVLPAGGSSRS